MRHLLDLEAPKSVPFELYIEEVEISQNRASTSDCLATASTFSTAGSCLGSFSSVGSVASTGGSGDDCGGCH